jgi:hypothetical protein
LTALWRTRSYDLQLDATLAQAGRRTHLAWDRQSPDIDPRTSRVRFTDDPSV